MEEITLKKILKKWGDSNIISFTSEELKILGLSKGNIMTIKVRRDDLKNE